MTTHKRGCICTKCAGERAALEHVAEDIKRRIQNEATALAPIQQCKDKDAEISRLKARCERLEHALETHGTHKWPCRFEAGQPNFHPCTCGLHAALDKEAR